MKNITTKRNAFTKVNRSIRIDRAAAITSCFDYILCAPDWMHRNNRLDHVCHELIACGHYAVPFGYCTSNPKSYQHVAHGVMRRLFKVWLVRNAGSVAGTNRLDQWQEFCTEFRYAAEEYCFA